MALRERYGFTRHQGHDALRRLLAPFYLAQIAYQGQDWPIAHDLTSLVRKSEVYLSLITKIRHSARWRDVAKGFVGLMSGRLRPVNQAKKSVSFLVC